MRTKRILTLALAVLLGTSGLMACDKGIEDTPVDAPSEGTVSDYEAATKPTADTARDEHVETEKTTSAISETDAPVDTTEEKADETPTYEMYSIGAFSDGLAPIATSAGYGFIDTNGNITIPPAYDEVADFYDGYARVCKNGKYGYIDKLGNPVIDLVYEDASAEFKEVTLVTKDGVKQYINREGAVVYTATGTEVDFGEFSNGYFWVETLEKKLSGNVSILTYYNTNGIIASSYIGYQNIGEYSSVNKYGYAFARNIEVYSGSLGSGGIFELALGKSPCLYSGELTAVAGSFVRSDDFWYLDYQKQEVIQVNELFEQGMTKGWYFTHWTKHGLFDENIYLAAFSDNFGSLVP